jgi:hypothetical protein
MQPTYKHLITLLSLMGLLIVSSFSAAAAPVRVGRAIVAAHDNTAQACASLQAGPVTWVTLDAQGQIDKHVASYPSDTTEIVPNFEYTCVPKNTTIVTVFTYQGNALLSDKEALKSSNQAGAYAYPLSTDDGSPLDHGQWKVSFYRDKTLLVSGVVQVGDDQGSSGVMVRGTVRDGNTRNPIKGAFVAVLKPGILVKTFLDAGKETDILASGTTDSLGQFSLNRPLARDTTYSLLVVARGYRPITRDDLRLSANDSDSQRMDVLMVK